MIKGIVSVSNEWAIGRVNKETNKGELLFHLPLDLKYFKFITSGHVVVFGYNTLLSLPNSKPLPNRVNTVLCPSDIEPEGCIVYHDFQKLVNDFLLLSRYQDIFICGGAMLYQSMLPYYDEVLVTKVDENVSDATAFFPNLDKLTNEFKITEESEPINDNGHMIKFVTYRRTSLC